MMKKTKFNGVITSISLPQDGLTSFGFEVSTTFLNEEQYKRILKAFDKGRQVSITIKDIKL